MELPTLESWKEREDLISIYRMVNNMEVIDSDLINLDTKSTRGHSKKLKEERCIRGIKKYSFPHRDVDTWNGLNEAVCKAGM